jgi:phage tail sheath protein FI
MDSSDKRFIADVLANSSLVQVARPLPRQRPDATHATHPGQPIPYVEMSSIGADGEELTDYDIIGSDEYGTGLFALDAASRVDLLCVPAVPSSRDLGITTFLAAERYCERRKAMLIWDAPSSWCSPEAALINLRDSSLASQNVMTYYPRVRLTERSGRVLDAVPASGVVAGLLCQNDRAGRWRGLAGGDVQLKAGLSVVESLTERQVSMLQRSGINVFSRTDHGTVELCGDVTLVGSRFASQLWRRLDRRRLAFFILGSIQRHTSWAATRPRDDGLWRDLTGQVSIFLTELFEQGAFVGRTAAQSFSVKTGPALQRDPDELVLRVGFALERVGELQVYDIVHRQDGSITRPAPALEVAQLTG